MTDERATAVPKVREERVVVRRRVVRKSVTVELAPRRAIRLGVRLILDGVKGSWRRRRVRLTLRTRKPERFPASDLPGDG